MYGLAKKGGKKGKKNSQTTFPAWTNATEKKLVGTREGKPHSNEGGSDNESTYKKG